jgi:hypothetical protein
MVRVDRVDRPARRVTIARAALVVGGLVGLVLTPTFASAYFAAYGINEGESPPGWLDDLAWASWEPSPGAVSDYERLGVAFGLSVLATAVALYMIVGGGCRTGRRERAAWALVYGGLGVVAVGSLGEYGIGGDSFAVAVGFVMEGLGFLVVVVGAARLGWALRTNGAAGLNASIAIGVGVPLGMVAGLFLVGHAPSGPAALLFVGAVAIGLAGLPATAQPRRFGVAD